MLAGSGFRGLRGRRLIRETTDLGLLDWTVFLGLSRDGGLGSFCWIWDMRAARASFMNVSKPTKGEVLKLWAWGETRGNGPIGNKKFPLWLEEVFD